MMLSGGISGSVSPRRQRIANEESVGLSPTLGGGDDSLHVCLYCFCDPCITEYDVLPSFVCGSAAPDVFFLGNAALLRISHSWH